MKKKRISVTNCAIEICGPAYIQLGLIVGQNAVVTAVAIVVCVAHFFGIDRRSIAGLHLNRLLPQRVVAGGGAEMKCTVQRQLSRLFRLQTRIADKSTVSGVEIDQKGPFQVSMVDEHRMHAGTGRVVEAEVGLFRVATEKVAIFFVNHQFLAVKELGLIDCDGFQELGLDVGAWVHKHSKASSLGNQFATISFSTDGRLIGNQSDCVACLGERHKKAWLPIT